MPTIKEYHFENLLNLNVTVVIKAYSQTQAGEILSTTIKHPEDFKLINETN